MVLSEHIEISHGFQPTSDPHGSRTSGERRLTRQEVRLPMHKNQVAEAAQHASEVSASSSDDFTPFFPCSVERQRGNGQRGNGPKSLRGFH